MVFSFNKVRRSVLFINIVFFFEKILSLFLKIYCSFMKAFFDFFFN